jgi:hypothetical protein
MGRKQKHLTAGEVVLTHALAFHMKAIGAAKVQNVPFACREAYFRMLPRDLRVTHHNVIVR